MNEPPYIDRTHKSVSSRLASIFSLLLWEMKIITKDEKQNTEKTEHNINEIAI